MTLYYNNSQMYLESHAVGKEQQNRHTRKKVFHNTFYIIPFDIIPFSDIPVDHKVGVHPVLRLFGEVSVSICSSGVVTALELCSGMSESEGA